MVSHPARAHARNPLAEAGEQRLRERRAIEFGGVLEQQRGGGGDGQFVASEGGVDADASDDRGHRRGGRDLHEDPGELASVDEDVVGPLQLCRNAGHGSHSVDGGDAAQQREPTEVLQGALGQPQQDRHDDLRAGHTVPGAGVATAAAVLELGEQHATVVAGRGDGEQIRVRRGRVGDDVETCVETFALDADEGIAQRRLVERCAEGEEIGRGPVGCHVHSLKWAFATYPPVGPERWSGLRDLDAAALYDDR